MRMPPKLFGDDDGGEDVSTLEIDKEYARRLEYNRKREDLQRYEELKQRGQIVDDDDDDDESEEEEDEIVGDAKKDLKFFDSLLKVRRRDPSLKDKDVKLFESDDEKDEDSKKDQKKDKKKKKKKKKLYLKDVQGVEEDSDKEEKKIKSYDEEQEELRKAVSDAMEIENDEDGEELLKETEKKGDDDDDMEVDEELVKKAGEYFGGGDGELDEKNKFLKDYLLNHRWKEKEKRAVIDEAELDELEDDEDAVEMQEEYESNYRHEENAGEIVMGYSRKVEGSVRKKDTARKIQRDNKDERAKMAEIERQEELKKLKNVKKKEMKEKLKKVLLVAGFKEGDECQLNAKDVDDEFDPEEYDKMMKAVFDDKYYDEEDSGLSSDEDGEKPDFDKEDELLGLPKDWDVIQGGDGFTAAREMALKQKEIADTGAGDDDKEEEEQEEEEEQVEGKRKRKQKISLVQRAKEALMEEYYKLDYEDTIGGDLKTRFKYAKVVPNRFDLETEEILGLEDSELNQYVPLKKIAPYREKDWEVNRHKVKEQKLKNKELLSQKKGKHDEKRSKKKRKQSDVVDVVTTEPASAAAEEGEGEASKLSRKAKRRRRQAEKKLPPSRMAAYRKPQ